MTAKRWPLPQANGIRLRFQLLAFSVTRTVLNTGFRMVYPFLPAIARGLGVELEAVTLAITARFSLGFFAPFLGSVAETHGRKAAMMAGMSVFTAGMLLVTLWPSYPSLFIALLLNATAKIMFDPATHSYLGDRVPYSQRGLAIALTEFGWSGAFLLGIPLAGWLIERIGWSAPFPMLTILGIVLIYTLWRIVPSDRPHQGKRPSFVRGFRTMLSYPSALAGMGVVALIVCSNEMVSIIYGAWMESAFGLRVAAVGTASAVIGIAELFGEGLVAGFVDRLGKRRAVGLGIAASALSCLLLPLTSNSIETALIGLFLFYLAFEFTIVSMLPLMTQLAPSVRATLMSTNLAGVSLARAIGSLVGPALFTGGMQTNSVTAAALNLIALITLIFFVKEQMKETDDAHDST